MCEKCYILKELFKSAERYPHQNYFPTIAFIKEMTKQNRIELFAGDCPLDEVERLLEEEKHYTICHYFSCKSCDQYFFIGACVRGTPIYKTMDNLEAENLDRMLWGHCGTLFEHKY